MGKVCILTSVHPVSDARIFHKEAKALAKAGYDITLIGQHSKNEIVDGIKIIALLKPKNRFQRIFGTTLKVFGLALKQKADIYHFHDPELIFIGLFLKIFTKAKVIYDVHEDVAKAILSKDWIPKFIRPYIAKIFDLLEKMASKKFDYTITATPSIKKNFYKKGVTNVRNFPITKNLIPHPTILKNKMRKKYFSIIYIGNLSKSNGITQIIQALEYLNPNLKVRIKLIGWFSPPDYKKKLSRLKGFEKVDCLRRIPLQEIPFYLGQADAGIVCALPEPNSLESEPNKLFEYMAASLPVIASNFPLWKEIIEGNNCGICVNPLDPKEIAKAVEYLIKHPEEAKRMGENGSKAILKKYNWEKEGEKLLNIYSKLLGGKRE